MQDEQSFNESQSLYVTLKEFIDNIPKSHDSKSQINDILYLLKSIIELLETDSNVRFNQNKSIYSLDDALQANVNVAIEFDERLTKLENMVTDIASNSAKLAEQLKNLAETASKIQINKDNGK